MKIFTCAQGSPEWHAARAGVITASMFETARAKLKTGPNKGLPTSAAADYAFRLAVERISGEPLDNGYETWQMQRGHELEPEARMEHEIQTGLVVQRAGFVATDDGMFGCSADGLIGSDSGAEYKCFIAPEKLRSIHIDGDASDIFAQVQGCMWITGRRSWHIGLYCPALRPAGKQLWWREFQRDDNYIESLEADMWAFKLLVDEYEDALRNKAA
ncbi:MAG: hypothetical protein GAK28_00171 [Luteibacter sp.]|uniref:lambda exonuclease family protein n=1 Tax=Luteibacter sp. TaxID=1886636 RepID=UPI00137D5A9A|nr:lambda exonuclease family protein [Luteibacter sp.]KAF1009533.1 MAG: hypothetical protein GAK28_00171 [Luteibacter sp.]